MIKVSVKLPLDYDENIIREKIGSSLKVPSNSLGDISLLKLSVDARDKSDVHYQGSFAVNAPNEKRLLKTRKCASEYKRLEYIIPELKNKNSARPIIVGAGPSGLFCAYVLAKSGLAPLVIERGQSVAERVKSVENFWQSGRLNPESNVQFGEGGAGTFSDGKLNTGVNDSRIPFVLKTFVECGAPSEILWRQKPHIGTDKLRQTVVGLRHEIEKLGGEIRFNCRMDRVLLKNGNVCGIEVTENGVTHQLDCDKLVLALGHSARDTFESLLNSGLEMTQKAFSVGARIEHTQAFINNAQYGSFANNKLLPVADYKLSAHLPNGRGVYTFCMCPGGFVVDASSESGLTAVNGMSNFDRAGKNANSAVLVGVTPDDFGDAHPLAGMYFQREIERKANEVGKGRPVVQTVGSFFGRPTEFADVRPTVNGNEGDINKVLPDFVCDGLRKGLLLLDSKLKGFASDNAVLTAPETRSSSPVRILRNDSFVANVGGVYPCGEGAGYAGGITSAAVDGIKVAEAILNID